MTKCITIKGILLFIISMLLMVTTNVFAQSTDGTTLCVGATRILQLRDGAYKVSFNGGKTYSTAIVPETTLKLDYKNFDPLTRAVDFYIPGALKATTTNVYIVQFLTQAFEAYQSELTALGAEIYISLASQALVVSMSSDVAAVVGKLPYVRWVGKYEPVYKLPTGDLTALVNSGYRSVDAARYVIMLFKKDAMCREDVAEQIRDLGGIVNKLDGKSFVIEATLTHAQLTEVIKMDDVQFVNKAGEPQSYMDIARETSGSTYLETVEGYKGQGVRGEVMDEGMYIGHSDFQKRPPLLHGIFGSGSADKHGTSTFGINFGDGSGDPRARGILPEGQGIFSSYRNLSNGSDRYTMTEELVNPSGSYRAVFQSNSWGYGTASDRAYTTYAAEIDDIVFNLDFLICQAMGNSADRATERLAIGKNVLSVGGIYHYDTLSKSDDKWGDGSIGPASDGRIKPDLSHFFDEVYSPTYSFNGYYDDFNGTSAATPLVAGFSGIMFQMWADGVFDGGPGKNRDVFDSRPHFSTAKALLINTASAYPFSGATHNLNRVHQGWGLPDVKEMYNVAKANNWSLPVLVNEDKVINPLERHEYYVNITGSTFLKATMVYADPKGNPGSSQHRINDLTLKVTAPGGTVYWGNNGLKAGNWSVAGGDKDTFDTVENVFIEQAQQGMWKVEILADEIVEDGHAETADLDADYALVVSTTDGAPNITPTPSATVAITPTPTVTPTPTPTQTPVEYINIAPGKVVNVSSTFAPDFAKGNAIDAAVNTIWASDTKNAQEWIYIDLGAQLSIDGLGLRWFDIYYAKKYRVAISNDGAKWTFVYTQNNGTGGVEQIYGSGKCRYIGILFTDKNDAAYALQELEVYQQK